MQPVEPPMHTGAHLVVFAKDQKPYIPLPASVDAQGLVMTEWEPTEEERERIFMGGRIRLWLHHTDVQRGRPLTPISIEAVDAPCPMDDHAR